MLSSRLSSVIARAQSTEVYEWEFSLFISSSSLSSSHPNSNLNTVRGADKASFISVPVRVVFTRPPLSRTTTAAAGRKQDRIGNANDGVNIHSSLANHITLPITSSFVFVWLLREGTSQALANSCWWQLRFRVSELQQCKIRSDKVGPIVAAIICTKTQRKV